MKIPFYCMSLKGPSITDEVRTILYIAACKMIQNRKVRIVFRDKIAAGTVTTEGNRQTIASAVSGILFTATLDCGAQNSIECTFLVNDRNLPTEESIREGAWIEPTGVEWVEET